MLYYGDAYYAEQALAYETQSLCADRTAYRGEHPIPVAWAMAWVGAVAAIGFSVGSVLQWLA